MYVFYISGTLSDYQLSPMNGDRILFRIITSCPNHLLGLTKKAT